MCICGRFDGNTKENKIWQKSNPAVASTKVEPADKEKNPPAST